MFILMLDTVTVRPTSLAGRGDRLLLEPLPVTSIAYLIDDFEQVLDVTTKVLRLSVKQPL